VSVQTPLGCYELPGAAQPSSVRPATDVVALGMVFNLEAQYDGFGVGGLPSRYTPGAPQPTHELLTPASRVGSGVGRPRGLMTGPRARPRAQKVWCI